MNTPSKPWPTTRLLEIPVDCPDQAGLIQRLIQHVHDRRDQPPGEHGTCWHLVTMNAEMAYAATEDADFMRLLQGADVIIPDGIGVVWALGHQGVPVKRLPGVELVEALFKQAPAAGLRLAILGSSPETLDAFKAQIPARFGNVDLVFAENGYFKPEDEPALIERLRASKADILFVALGVPRQESWIASHRNELAIPVLMGVGGSFDVLSGRLQRAPVWMQRSHVEWLYRLYQQPTRWKRMLALPRFVAKVLRP